MSALKMFKNVKKGGSPNGYIRTTKCFSFQGQVFSTWNDCDQWTIDTIDTRGGYYPMLVQTTTYGTKTTEKEDFSGRDGEAAKVSSL